MAGPGSTHSDSARDAFFTRVVGEHARMMYRVAHSVLRSPEDSEDAVGDALLKLLRGNAWKEIANEKAFLARTVWRAALDRLGTRNRNAEKELEGELPSAEIADRRPSPETYATQARERSLLNTMIERLPGELREVLLLSAVQELNSREIGEVLQLPEGTVRTRLMRARSNLREHYEDHAQSTQRREVAAREEGS